MKKIYFLFYDDYVMLQLNKEPLEFPETGWVDEVINPDKKIALGVYNDAQCFAIPLKEKRVLKNCDFFSLKLAIQKIGHEWFTVLSKAYQVLQWDEMHQFCGRCGKSIVQVGHQFEKRCNACQLSFFPKISPAIIVLIKKGNQILMARKKEFAEGVYALIAGFSEPGETLEETVHREVYEEVGLFVKNIQYVCSQSWPFPHSLMVGFTADYVSGDIALLDGELEKAGWYDLDHLPGMPSSSTSIAALMIQLVRSKKKS